MKTIGVQSHVGSFVVAVALLLQISPALAGAPDAAPAMTQGSRVPGFPVPSTDAARNKHRTVVITFTKWITTYPLMTGFTGGDVAGDFVGEVLERQVSRDLRVIKLEAIYEVQSGEHSFTALIRGGTGETKKGEPANDSGAALLDGVILTGWRTGAKVHVAFQTTTNCPGTTDVPKCFRGTITVSPDSQD
jgi:hypothetical protein